MSKNVYVVIGSSGRIASRIVHELLADLENQVYGVDIKPANDSDNSIWNLTGRFTYFKVDVLNYEELRSVSNAIYIAELTLKGILNAFWIPESQLPELLVQPRLPEAGRIGQERNCAIANSFINLSGESISLEVGKTIIGIHNVTRLFWDLMLQSGDVSIVNITSQYGQKVPNQDLFINDNKFTFKLPGYSLAKAAIITYTEYLSSVLSNISSTHGVIRANCVSPGNIKQSNHSKDFEDRYSKLTWTYGMPDVEDIVPGIMLLLSKGSRYMNATILNIDGGWVRK
jgi:NAD(P)-dependent dehydrogenase (short-subunit alcohol dehydrogenase family)